MPPRKGGGPAGKQRNRSLDNIPRPFRMTHGASHAGKNPLAAKPSQSQFNIAPLIVEGVKVNKIQLNDMLKQQFSDVRIADIQLNRAGNFTLFARDVKSFNRMLNELTPILVANGQPTAKIYVPRSIQRIKDTETVAFVKRVDLELTVDRITEALKDVGLDVIDVIRLSSKDGNTPMRTIKITFKDAPNRNTFVHTGLQVESMHFIAEAASHNTKPVQCYICLQYNHVAKYCKTKQQVCARCGDNHRIEQCTAANDTLKCFNCKGNHLATTNDCPKYKEQEKRMLNLINQYSSTSKPTPTAPFLHNANEYPSLPGMYQRQQGNVHNDILEELINVLTTKMEKIIEETTDRLFKSLAKKIKKIEKAITSVEDIVNVEGSTDSDTDSDEDTLTATIKQKQQAKMTQAQQNSRATNASTEPKTKTPATTTSTISTSTTSTQSPIPTHNNTTTSTIKPKKAKKLKRKNRTPNSSLDSTTMDSKDHKTDNNDD